MPNLVKKQLLDHITETFGKPKKLQGSLSLFDIAETHARLYVRYSRKHPGNRTFFGLRQDDLHQLEGHNSFICFLWDDQREPLFVPFSDYEEVLRSTRPASDGQYKVQIYTGPEATELYIAQAGRFNVDAHWGWEVLGALGDQERSQSIPDFGHSQVQTILGCIGSAKGYDIWVPPADRERLDWTIGSRFECHLHLPQNYAEVSRILEEVDVIWLKRGANSLGARFEVEHSTPVYSGLLRLNDVHLVAPTLNPRFSIVSNEDRRDLFVRQLNRPTFRMSGLSERCTFLNYADVYGWYRRLGGVSPGV